MLRIRQSILGLHLSMGLALTLLLFSISMWLPGCNNGGQGQDFAEPGGAPEKAPISFTPPSPQGQSAVAGIIERHRAELANIPGVHGVSEGRTLTGDPAVRIDVEDASVRARLPKEIEGYPVEVVVVPGGFGILPAK